jgi:acyl carrier protein
MDNQQRKSMNQAEALAWVAEVFQEPADTLTVETLRKDIAMWDSLGVLTLMAELDEKFDLVISDQETRAMTKVGDILALLQTNGKLNS